MSRGEWMLDFRFWMLDDRFLIDNAWTKKQKLKEVR
jgi:hypothetical protein